MATKSGRHQGKEELAGLRDQEKSDHLINPVLRNIEILGESSTIAQVFVNHYQKKVTELVRAYPAETISAYRKLLLRKKSNACCC